MVIVVVVAIIFISQLSDKDQPITIDRVSQIITPQTEFFIIQNTHSLADNINDDLLT